MSWRRIDSRLVRQDTPNEQLHWYWDDARLGGGELLLWEDAAGRVVRFQLAQASFPRNGEYLADWRQGSSLRLGVVESTETAAGFPASPLVRYATPDPSAVARVRAYFAANAHSLTPDQRACVAAALGDAPASPLPRG